VLLSHRHRQLLHDDLRRLQAYTHSILENLMSGVISYDQNSRITSINQKACWLLRVKASAVVQEPLTVLPPALLQCLRLDHPSADPHRIWLPIAGDQRRLISVRSKCIQSEQGDQAWIVLLDDITDQTLLEQQINRNQRLQAIRTMASSVAHEIKNPLNSIKLLVDLIKKKYQPAKDGVTYHQRLATVHQEIDRITTIVDQYLQFSRMPAISLAPLNFPALIAEVAALCEAGLNEKGIALTVQVAPHALLRGDRNQLEQVFINLLKNAEEAMDAGGTILITSRQTGSHYEIRVQDNGKGIREQDLASIFDFHFTTKKNGSGIGLSLAQQIIEAHHGNLLVESEAGHGATFILQFPSASPPAES